MKPLESLLRTRGAGTLAIKHTGRLPSMSRWIRKHTLGPSPPPCDELNGHQGLAAAWTTLGVDPKNGTIVNLGATLARGGSRSDNANSDDAWGLFLNVSDVLQLRMVAFEASESSLRDTQKLLDAPGSPFYLTQDKRKRVKLVNAYVRPATIVHELEKLQVPGRFPLLKIDLDSVDFESFVAIAERFHPRLVFAERSDWPHAEGLLFSSLSVGPAHEGGPTPLYGAGSTGSNFRKRFSCQGVSSKMWLTYPERFQRNDSYRVVRWDGGKNYLLVRGEDAHKFPAVPWMPCLGVKSAWAKVRPEDAIAYVANGCNTSNTPYFLEHGGVCCPGPAAGPLCRCSLITSPASYALGGWRLPPVSVDSLSQADSVDVSSAATVVSAPVQDEVDKVLQIIKERDREISRLKAENARLKGATTVSVREV